MKFIKTIFFVLLLFSMKFSFSQKITLREISQFSFNLNDVPQSFPIARSYNLYSFKDNPNSDILATVFCSKNKEFLVATVNNNPEAGHMVGEMNSTLYVYTSNGELQHKKSIAGSISDCNISNDGVFVSFLTSQFNYYGEEINKFYSYFNGELVREVSNCKVIFYSEDNQTCSMILRDDSSTRIVSYHQRSNQFLEQVGKNSNTQILSYSQKGDVLILDGELIISLDENLNKNWESEEISNDGLFNYSNGGDFIIAQRAESVTIYDNKTGSIYIDNFKLNLKNFKIHRAKYVDGEDKLVCMQFTGNSRSKLVIADLRGEPILSKVLSTCYLSDFSVRKISEDYLLFYDGLLEKKMN